MKTIVDHNMCVRSEDFVCVNRAVFRMEGERDDVHAGKAPSKNEEKYDTRHIPHPRVQLLALKNKKAKRR